MPKHPQKRFLPTLALAAVIALAVAACGGSSDSSSGTDLAAFVPADAQLFIEGAVQPEGDVASNVEAISEKLTGESLGAKIKAVIASSSDTDFDFEADVEPWLGESAGMFGGIDSSPDSLTSAAMGDDPQSGAELLAGDDRFGLVAQTTDVDAAEAFIEKVAEQEEGGTKGEYEGVSYTVPGEDEPAVGIVDDHLVAAADVELFEKMVDASKGDSLKDAEGYAEVADKAPDGSLVNVYVSNDAATSAGAEDGFDLTGLYRALGMDFQGTGTLVSLVPNEDEISVRVVSGGDSDMESGDATDVIETFPADTVLAFGSGDVGANATKAIDALNDQGIKGVLKPGQLNRAFEQLEQQGLDVKSLIGNLETVALFVNGNSVNNAGGAVVATTSDIKPIEDSLQMLSTLMSFGESADVRPLKGGMTGLRIRVPELQGRPIVLAVGDDRLVIAIGMPAARQALGRGGHSLGDSPAFKAALDSLPGDGIDLFADPIALAELLSGFAGDDPSATEVIDVLGKFEYLAGGSGEEDNSAELNLGLSE